MEETIGNHRIYSLVNCCIAMENGPRKFVSFPMNSYELSLDGPCSSIAHSYVKLQQGIWFYSWCIVGNHFNCMFEGGAWL